MSYGFNVFDAAGGLVDLAGQLVIDNGVDVLGTARTVPDSLAAVGFLTPTALPSASGYRQDHPSYPGSYKYASTSANVYSTYGAHDTVAGDWGSGSVFENTIKFASAGAMYGAASAVYGGDTTYAANTLIGHADAGTKTVVAKALGDGVTTGYGFASYDATGKRVMDSNGVTYHLLMEGVCTPSACVKPSYLLGSPLGSTINLFTLGQTATTITFPYSLSSAPLIFIKGASTPVALLGFDGSSSAITGVRLVCPIGSTPNQIQYRVYAPYSTKPLSGYGMATFAPDGRLAWATTGTTLKLEKMLAMDRMSPQHVNAFVHFPGGTTANVSGNITQPLYGGNGWPTSAIENMDMYFTGNTVSTSISGDHFVCVNTLNAVAGHWMSGIYLTSPAFSVSRLCVYGYFLGVAYAAGSTTVSVVGPSITASDWLSLYGYVKTSTASFHTTTAEQTGGSDMSGVGMIGLVTTL